MPKKTHLPQQIIAYLRRHPTADRRHLAEALGVSYQAVQKHLRRMEDEGDVASAFLVNDAWDADRHEFWIFIETRFDPRTRDEAPPAQAEKGIDDYQRRLCEAVVERLCNDPQWTADLSFVDIKILLGGQWDVVLRLSSTDADSVGRFVTRYLRSLPTVVRTSTAWALSDRGER